jgi:hypothetical protein
MFLEIQDNILGESEIEAVAPSSFLTVTDCVIEAWLDEGNKANQLRH